VKGLHEVFGDVADEITPADPPVGPAMLRGRGLRRRRLATAVGGAAVVLALVAGGVAGIPALAGHDHAATPVSSATAHAGEPLIRPALLLGAGNQEEVGNPRLVDPAVLKLFNRLNCVPQQDPAVPYTSWQAGVGYTTAGWNAPDQQIVSCDAAGGKYVLGPAVVRNGQATASYSKIVDGDGGWQVNLALTRDGRARLGKEDASLYKSYGAGAAKFVQGNGNSNDTSAQDRNDFLLDSVCVLAGGEVLDSQPGDAKLDNANWDLFVSGVPGYTKAQAAMIAARFRPAG
jgi:hypothetical protein